MQIDILQCLGGTEQAAGLTVVIDVFRAFSVACYVMDKGAAGIIPVGGIDMAYQLKAAHPDYLLIGEREGKIQPGFDYGNSPAQLEHAAFQGKTVVHTTSAGTQGIVNAVHAEQIVTGSLVNAQAVADYIRAAHPQRISLVCMGRAGVAPVAEDTVCAEYIRSLLEGTYYDIGAAIIGLKESGGKRFFDPANAGWCPERDFYLCTDLNRFDFVLKAGRNGSGLYSLRKVRAV